MRILVLGVTGMLGYSMFENLREKTNFEVFGTVRSLNGKLHFFEDSMNFLIQNVDVHNFDTLECAVNKVKPQVVINCIGLIKQQSLAKQHVDAVTINSLLPHKIATLCDDIGAKLIHFSTDCVFDGAYGKYTEHDLPTAKDLYGKSKILGEVDYKPHLTLRTSILGHELTSCVSLVDWFLTQEGEVDGFSRAIFSGFPTCYIARFFASNMEALLELSGLYHFSSSPIDKYSLLTMIANIYGKSIKINNSNSFVIDRSLDSSSLQGLIGFRPPEWSLLIEEMYKDYKTKYINKKEKSC